MPGPELTEASGGALESQTPTADMFQVDLDVLFLTKEEAGHLFSSNTSRTRRRDGQAVEDLDTHEPPANPSARRKPGQVRRAVR